MLEILQKFLKSKGVGSAAELDATPNPDGSPTERDVFENYRKVLDKEELSVADIKNFLTQQIGTIESHWKNLNTPNARKAELIAYHTVYKTLESAINAPRAEREQLEAQLNSLIK